MLFIKQVLLPMLTNDFVHFVVYFQLFQIKVKSVHIL